MSTDHGMSNLIGPVVVFPFESYKPAYVCSYRWLHNVFVRMAMMHPEYDFDQECKSTHDCDTCPCNGRCYLE